MINLKRAEDCCGCAACVSVCPARCISMKEDAEGFLYPETDVSKCIDCHLCEKVCPIINKRERPTNFPTGSKNPIVFSATNDDEEIRVQSSSGGIFSALAKRVIENGGVVFGVRWSEDFTEVVHDFSETLEGISAFRGSKYLQSKIGSSFREARKFLQMGREVLFTGTPCQIAGLRNTLRKDFPNLLAVEVVCHGVPSAKIWKIYLKDLKRTLRNHSKGTEGDNKKTVIISSLSLRSKSPPGGWKRYGLECMWTLQGDTHTNRFWEPCHYWAENTYMNAFLSDLGNRPSCSECPAKSQRSGADLTLGDFWGVDSYFDDDRGCSLVLANTQKGLDAVRELGSVTLIPSTYEKARGIRSLEVSLLHHPKRSAFFKAVNGGASLSEVVRKLKPLPYLTRIRRNGKQKCFSIAVSALRRLGLLQVLKKISGKEN